MKFYLLAAFLFVAMVAVTAVPLEEPFVDSVSNSIEGRANTRPCGSVGGGNWLCSIVCRNKGHPSGYCKKDVCYCRR